MLKVLIYLILYRSLKVASFSVKRGCRQDFLQPTVPASLRIKRGVGRPNERRGSCGQVIKFWCAWCLDFESITGLGRRLGASIVAFQKLPASSPPTSAPRPGDISRDLSPPSPSMVVRVDGVNNVRACPMAAPRVRSALYLCLCLPK